MKNNYFIFIIIILIVSCNVEPRRPILSKSSSGIEQSVSYNKKLIAKQEIDFKKIIKQDSTNVYIASDLGFWYTFNFKSNNNYFPKTDDEVVYSYEVYNLNHEIIYSKENIGIQNYFVDKQEIIEGLREGLKLMNIEDNVTFLFPSHKVFGYLGDQKKIGINQPLIYKVQLIKINKKNESN